MDNQNWHDLVQLKNGNYFTFIMVIFFGRGKRRISYGALEHSVKNMTHLYIYWKKLLQYARSKNMHELPSFVILNEDLTKYKLYLRSSVC